MLLHRQHAPSSAVRSEASRKVEALTAPSISIFSAGPWRQFDPTSAGEQISKCLPHAGVSVTSLFVTWNVYSALGTSWRVSLETVVSQAKRKSTDPLLHKRLKYIRARRHHYCSTVHFHTEHVPFQGHDDNRCDHNAICGRVRGQLK